MNSVTKADQVKQKAESSVAQARMNGFKLAAKAQTAKAKARAN